MLDIHHDGHTIAPRVVLPHMHHSWKRKVPMSSVKQIKWSLAILAVACTVRAAPDDAKFTEAELNYWAYQKVQKPALPSVKNRGWVKTPVDAFILKELESKLIKPAPPAEKIALLRRATFDLTGLPPTPEEVRSFL